MRQYRGYSSWAGEAGLEAGREASQEAGQELPAVKRMRRAFPAPAKQSCLPAAVLWRVLEAWHDEAESVRAAAVVLCGAWLRPGCSGLAEAGPVLVDAMPAFRKGLLHVRNDHDWEVRCGKRTLHTPICLSTCPKFKKTHEKYMHA